MKNCRFKRQYSPSRRLVAVFRAAFVIALGGFLFQFAALFFPTGSSLTFHAEPLAIAFFVGGTCFVFVLLAANATLWFGMLHFLIKYDGRAFGNKAFWAVITFLGLSVGAALYYWFIYRKYVASIHLWKPGTDGTFSDIFIWPWRA